MQLLHEVLKSWKNHLSNVKDNTHNLVFHEHHLIRKHHLYFLNALSNKEIYNFHITKNKETTSSKLYYQNKFNDNNFDWKNIYLLVDNVPKDSKLRAFQFKLLNNVLYLNKMIFKFGKIRSSLCSFCNFKD